MTNRMQKSQGVERGCSKIPLPATKPTPPPNPTQKNNLPQSATTAPYSITLTDTTHDTSHNANPYTQDNSHRHASNSPTPAQSDTAPATPNPTPPNDPTPANANAHEPAEVNSAPLAPQATTPHAPHTPTSVPDAHKTYRLPTTHPTPHTHSHNASTTPPSNAPCSHKHPPTKLPLTRPPHPASSPTPPPSRANASAVSPPPDETAPKRACHTPSRCRPPTPRASQSAQTAFLTECPVLPAKSAGRARGFRGWLGTERARLPEPGGGLWARVAGRDRRGVGDRRRVGRLGGGRG
jgi:hypothetical protein